LNTSLHSSRNLVSIGSERAHGLSHTGLRRTNNEDGLCIRPLPEGTLLAVADGLGGEAGGEEASAAVIQALLRRDLEFPSLERRLQEVERAILEVNQELLDAVERDPDKKGMGSTLTAALLHRERLGWVHLGDSRLYLLHALGLEQLTRDDRFLQDFIDSGELTIEQAAAHPLRNHLDQCVGSPGITVHLGTRSLLGGERLLLCSDGLYEMCEPERIETILRLASAPANATQALLAAALRGGGLDNVTVIVQDT
jgi:PPM family protein phosphatase